MKDLTLIIPAKEEAESLPHVLDEIKKLNLNCRIKVCLDKNDIKTIKAINSYDIEIYYQKIKGYGSALTEGIKTNKTKFFCIFNADGSFRPSELKTMYDKLNNHKYDFIFGSRYIKNSGSEDDTFITYIGNQIFSILGNILFKLNIDDILYTFVLGKTSIFNKLNMKSADFRFCVELPIKAKSRNYKITQVNSYERLRLKGKKKVNALIDGYLILIEMIKLFFFNDTK